MEYLRPIFGDKIYRISYSTSIAVLLTANTLYIVHPLSCLQIWFGELGLCQGEDCDRYGVGIKNEGQLTKRYIMLLPYVSRLGILVGEFFMIILNLYATQETIQYSSFIYFLL